MSLMKDINQNKDLVEKNKYIENAEKGLELVSRLQSVKEEKSSLEDKFNKLEKLIEDNYLKLTNKSNFTNEAQTYRNMEKAKDELEEIIKFPFLANKHIVAVGGGFSAGKSQFLNSLLGRETLPTNTRPTTSIPTFIANGEEDKIYPYNIFGNKAEIDEEALKAITHSFYEKYNMSFTTILKNINLEIKNISYNNIAFLDTPGYTKSDFQIKADNTDKTVAKKHLQVADYLIWIIDIEKGTIPREDINFINDIQTENPILFIVNKADKKIKSDIEEIIKTIQKDLNSSDINYYGVMAYSSKKNKIYSKDYLTDFLDNIDNEEKEVNLLNQFNTVFKRYIDYHNEKIHKEKEKLEKFNEFSLFNSTRSSKLSNEDKSFIDNLINSYKKNIRNEKEIVTEFKNLKKQFSNLW